jgi:hypothetical protein
MQTRRACRRSAANRPRLASEGSPVRIPGISAAPKCSNQADLHLTLADLLDSPDPPQRPSLTSMRLVCIQGVKFGAAPRGAVWPGVSGGLDLGGPPAARRATGIGADAGSAPGDADLANAVANNGSGRARTRLEPPSRRVACQRAVWTTVAGSGRTGSCYGSALGTAGAAPYRREKWLRYRP